MTPIPFVALTPNAWGLITEWLPSIERWRVVLAHPNGSTCTADLCSMADARGAEFLAVAEPGQVVVMVKHPNYGVVRTAAILDVDIRPEHFLPAVTTRRHYHTDEGHARRVEVTGCLDCPFRSEVERDACRFIPGVKIPRDIVGTLSGCPMLRGESVTVTLRGDG